MKRPVLPDPAPIYLDHHATTPVDPRVAQVVLDAMVHGFGNANSVDHAYGEAAAALVADARREVAALVDADPEDVHFTSGSSEGIRLAFAHAVASRPRGGQPLRCAVTVVEHKAVLDAVAYHERAGDLTVRWLPVDAEARVDSAAVEDALAEGVDLLCVMAANNEVGTLYPIEEIARSAESANVRLLVDATQAAGRVPLEVGAWGVSYLCVSAHKIYGPKGVGALIAPGAVDMRPAHGPVPGTGDGTPNVPGILGLGEACRLRRAEMHADEPRLAAQRDRLEAILADHIDGLVVNGDRQRRLTNNLHVSVPDVPNDAVLARLRRHVAVSTGAACSSGAQTPSHVLRAMGLPDALQEGALRISAGKFTTDEEIERAGAHIVEAVAATRRAAGGRAA